MKKLQLISLAILVAAGNSFAQKGTIKTTENEIIKTEKTDLKNQFKLPDYSQPESFNIKGTDDIELIYIGKSGNVYSVLLEKQHCLSYDQDADAFMMTHRADPDTYPNAYNNGTIMANISTDGGDTWEAQYALNEPDNNFRYPSGVVFNPNNLNDINDCYGVFMGISIQGGGDWTHKYFASLLLDGNATNYHIDLLPMDLYLYDTYRFGLCTTDDGMFHGGGCEYYGSEGGAYTEYFIKIMNGTFNEYNNYFDLDEILIELTDYLGTNSLNKLLLWGNTRMAWNNDGTVGYVFTNGTLNSLAGSAGYQPIVFKSTDQGQYMESD